MTVTPLILAKKDPVEPTLREVWEDYKTLRQLKPNTITNYEKALNLGIPDWLDISILKIKKNMVVERHAFLSKKNGPKGEGKSFANMVFRTLRALITFAMYRYENDEGEPLIKLNPVRALAELRLWNKTRRREGHLHPDEMADWYSRVMDNLNETQRDYLIVILFTGLRKNEAAGLRWSSINFTTKTLRIEDTKNGKPHTLPLGPFLMQLLSARFWYFAPSKDDYIFQGRFTSTPLSKTSKAYEKIWEGSDKQFMLHDLRRTFLTIAESLDIPHYSLKRLANHSNVGDVTEGYMFISPERLREPMERIEATLMNLCGAKMRF